MSFVSNVKTQMDEPTVPLNGTVGTARNSNLSASRLSDDVKYKMCQYQVVTSPTRNWKHREFQQGPEELSLIKKRRSGFDTFLTASDAYHDVLQHQSFVNENVPETDTINPSSEFQI
mmetsp:Transcript_19927/g.26298  ORF Transcript_19927/g.26298 Transcript_19927/m.26298 type:complete len:117 (-) Transcript_19927:45-395(-)